MRHSFAVVCVSVALAGTLLPRPAMAKPFNVLVIGPLGAGASESTATAATQAIVKKISDGCGGYTASLFDPTNATKTQLGTEDFDVYVNAQAPTTPGGIAPPTPNTTSTTGTSANGITTATTTIQLIDVAIVSASTHDRLVSQPQSFNAADASKQNFCASLASGTGKSGPVDVGNFFNIVPDADADRVFSDVLTYQLRQYGFDGALAPINFDQAQPVIASTCGTGRGVLRYHVIQSNNEKKAIGATEVATAVAGSILRCGSAPVSVDTLFAPQQSKNHFVSVGTLVSTLVGLAVALKPKISTAQLTAAEPLFSGLVNGATLTTDNQKAASDAFSQMLYTYCHPPSPAPMPSGCKLTPPPPKKRSLFNLPL